MCWVLWVAETTKWDLLASFPRTRVVSVHMAFPSLQQGVAVWFPHQQDVGRSDGATPGPGP